MESSHFLALPAALCGLVQMLRESALALVLDPTYEGGLSPPREKLCYALLPGLLDCEGVECHDEASVL